MTDVTAQNSQQSSYVDDYAPPANDSGVVTDSAPLQPDTVSSTPVSTGAPSSSEAIEDQNIFVLLGIEESSDEEKEMFLDELQQVIWEDFVEKDIELLLTEDELKEFQSISRKDDRAEEVRQTQMIEFLEKLIPDLEKIMLEKAIELKEQMTIQRIQEYVEFFKDDAAKLEEVKKAQAFADELKWKSVSDTLNSIAV